MSEATSAIEDPIFQAIRRAQEALFARQDADGAWRGCDGAGPPTTGWALVSLGYLGALRREDAAGAVRFLLDSQLPSGAFPDYPGDAEGSLAATCAAYAGLHAAGHDALSNPMERAWSYIADKGGFQAADPITQTFLAAAGLVSPSSLFAFPMGWMLIPGARRLLGLRLNTAFQLIASALPGLVRGLQRRRATPVPAHDLCGWMETENLIRYLKRVQDPTGHWLGTAFHTGLCAMTLYALGLPLSDPAIQRAIAYFPRWRYPVGDKAWQFAPYNSESWNASLSVAALVRSGIAPDDPRIRRATVFLLSSQGHADEPREWQNPERGAPRQGGWAFEESNAYNLDCDSTSQALRALAAVRRLSSVNQTIDEGVAWLLGMQNSDGGFPSFTRGQPSKPAGPYALGMYSPNDLLEQIFVYYKNWKQLFGDPATEDLTGRVLEALGLLGHTIHDPPVARAVAFIRSQIFENGVWWGRWECNFIPSTAYILVGLAAVGENLDAPYVRRAVAWIESHQNADGGFGERVDSYGNLAYAGLGESNPYVTGLVVSALIAVGGKRDAIERAVAYLVREQRPDGLWPGRGYMLVMNTPVPFYKIPANVWTTPLHALADYRMWSGGVKRVAPQ